jgi:hypothetical protein
MKRSLIIFIVLVIFLLSGIETHPSTSNMQRTPINVLIHIDEDKTYTMLLDGRVSFAVGQIIKKASAPIFSQYFDKMELSTDVISPDIGKDDLIIILVFKDFQYQDNIRFLSADYSLNASIKIIIQDSNALTFWEEIYQ